MNVRRVDERLGGTDMDADDEDNDDDDTLSTSLLLDIEVAD